MLIDAGDPMSLTSAASGENYRNWWPHPVMTAFTDGSIDRLEEIATLAGNRIAMSRSGYVLVTRRTRPFDLIEDLYRGYGEAADRLIRIHEGPGTAAYEEMPSWAGVLSKQEIFQIEAFVKSRPHL